MKLFLLIVKNVRRNLLRTTLTSLGTMVLVFVVTLVWSILSFLDAATTEQAKDLKVIITERWRLPSQMPFAYAEGLSRGAARTDADLRPSDSMTWQFYGGTVDPDNRAPENMVFAISLEPEKLLTMMDELDELQGDKRRTMEDLAGKLERNKQGLLLGRDRLAALNKRPGERVTFYGLNYKDINLEFEILGVLPDGTRYDNSAFINRRYLNDALDDYARNHNNKPHAMAAKTLNLVWLRVPDRDAFNRIAQQVERSPEFTNPAVKCETQSAGISTFMESYRDLIWGMRWLLAPAILVTLSLVISNAISISVRERLTEMAVLKVLGFRPVHVLVLVLGEAVFLGTLAGVLSAGLTFYVINYVIGGLKFPIAFFAAFFIPKSALAWGLGIGALTAFAGALVPAWSARSVKVSDVFAKVG